MELSDLGAFFAAFGLRPRPEERDRADHVSCECELMAFLARKEAFALEREDEQMLERTRKGSRCCGRWSRADARPLVRHQDLVDNRDGGN